MNLLGKIALLPLLFVMSCSSDTGTDSSSAATTPPRKSLTERMNENNGYKQDAEGNWKPQNDRRSPFENKGESYYAQKNFKKQEYKAGDYSKKSFWGNKEYDRKSYTGDTDGSRFQKSSDLQGKDAREAANDAKIKSDYQTADYATNAAREANKKDISKPSDDQIENRRAVGDIDWHERRALSIEQSKSLLGN